jgi:hypothetical protein
MATPQLNFLTPSTIVDKDAQVRQKNKYLLEASYRPFRFANLPVELW